MSENLTEAQQKFLITYTGLLKEVESSLQFISECYTKGDLDIGDRLMKQIMLGLIPYNEENLTVMSVFGNDETAVGSLKKFQKAIHKAVNVETEFNDEGERMKFLHEELIPGEQKWKQHVELKLAGLSED
ncbi:hypothetical protein MM300_05440 [Evansella sp. LMS18]|jgi:hypothetical protein|uniref:hypothetical protein n=1 Tax=Evansella sp. LMS18 TaxID=2924033 RepID=UPI0020D172D4|nr:hypothetical protein [Evansella sp. LMS18]UTR11746.1 hypothetical protein MM300_05440 [Evansella sp. LMS18]